ncbi:MAG: hypothetical protein AMJ90_00780 [candidate division Zixibacteria bacterium SM23_73_2]|nr:MAG: hypothetical protein AMJ90_00780 [candidate division Zixibacteria bacterium SM23_73_2]
MKYKAFFEKMFLPLILVPFGFFLFNSCGGRPDPRKTVMDFVKAVAQSDSLTLDNLVDFEVFTQKKYPDLPEEKIPATKQRLKRNLLKSGITRVKWENYRKVLGDVKFEGDTANVELTLMHLKTGIYSYTTVRMYLKEGKWKIFYYED